MAVGTYVVLLAVVTNFYILREVNITRIHCQLYKESCRFVFHG